MTENEAKKLVENMQISKDCEMVKTLELQAVIIKALEDVQAYRAIGTVEECRQYKVDIQATRNATIDEHQYEKGYADAIDEAIEISAKAICVGCGYLDGYKCNYKGANCGVSKPMLESVVKALEKMKGGAE